MAAPRLALSLMVLVLVVCLAEGLRGSGPKKCCSSFHETKVSRDRVVGYMKTSQRCSKQAVMLKMTTGRRLCVRPSAVWVKELISYLDTKSVLGEASHL